MQITQNKVVSLHYVVKDDSGSVLESTRDREPLVYIQGTQTILPLLEEKLEGKQEGDSLKIRIPMEDAYGPRREELIAVVGREQFSPDVEISVGQEFYYLDENDQMMTVTIVGVEDEAITIDSNHPFAGMDLNFELEVVGVRDATAEEIDHGHVHGPGGVEH